MLRVRAAIALAFAVSAFAQVPAGEYAARRQALRKSLDDAVLVLFGNTERDVDDVRTGFYQEPNFYYLTGFSEPRAILLLTGGAETLFLPQRNATVERYTGAKAAPGDADILAKTGFEQVLPLPKFESSFAAAIETADTIFTLRERPGLQSLEKLAPMRRITDASRLLMRRRARKSPAEIALIKKATDVSVQAHLAAWQRVAPGLSEHQVAATMLFAMQDQGCRAAYPPIIGSGSNSTVLHYEENRRRIEAGDIVLMDVAASCGEYASDMTRTVPASGRFTEHQRELYDAVLRANRAAIEAVKPGATMKSINEVARKALGPLSKYLPHGISHGVGLEPHDAPSHLSEEPFAAGMVITIEPGVYIPEEKTGIRIEDILLVTEAGAEVLSAALPKEAADIERALAGRRQAAKAAAAK